MNIARLRALRGLNQEELADLVGIKQPTLSRAENGNDGTTLRIYRSIAAALNVPLADLFLDDRAADEISLIDLYRALPEDRKQLWREMARAFAGGPPPPTP